MRYYIFFLVLQIAVCSGCKQNKAADAMPIESAVAASRNEVEMASPNRTIPTAISMLGSYTGDFGDNKITILLTEISNDSVHGRSIVAGHDQVFTGTFSKTGTVYRFVAKEPGKSKYDGIFNFETDANVEGVLSGSWTPYDSSKIKRKDFKLEKKQFIYDPNNGDTDASKRLLKTKDVENEDKWSLFFMRNEIFARHGYSFSRRETRDLFESESWYVPYSVDVRKDLTTIEKKNIVLIKQYEKYAKDYGDDYGR